MLIDFAALGWGAASGEADTLSYRLINPKLDAQGALQFVTFAPSGLSNGLFES